MIIIKEQLNAITKRRLILFVLFSILIGWALFLTIPMKGLTYGDSYSVTILAVAMFAPTLANLLTRVITREGFKDLYLKPNFKGNFKKYLLIFFGPSILIFLGGVIYFVIFPGSFDGEFTQLNAIMAQNGSIGTTAKEQLLITGWIIVLFGPIINIVPTLGEEFGWRGYLLPKLREICSNRWALVITGAIWGIWHLPAIAMGHNYGVNYVGYPWLGILGMIIFCIVLGIIEGYATIKLNSVIPAAMIHSVVNAGAAFPLILIKGDYNPLIGPAIVGVIGGLPFIILAIILFIKINNSK